MNSLECPYRLSQAIMELLAAICGSYHEPATGLGIFIRYLVNSLAETSFGYIQRNKKTAGYSLEPFSIGAWLSMVIERNDTLLAAKRKFRKITASKRAKMAHQWNPGGSVIELCWAERRKLKLHIEWWSVLSTRQKNISEFIIIYKCP